MTTTLSSTQESAIRDWLAAHPTLSVGVGTAERACSIAAINLALSGQLTDEVPPCMSPVIGRWIIGVQDTMPDTIRNSADWRNLLPLAAGTGRGHEPERVAIIMDWMWGTALPLVQPVADQHGFGAQWRTMCEQRTADTARAARAAADDVDAYANAAKWAASAAVAASAAYASVYAAAAAGSAAWAASATARVDANAAYAAADVDATWSVADDAAIADAWATLDPVGLLRRLIAVTDTRVEDVA